MTTGRYSSLVVLFGTSLLLGASGCSQSNAESATSFADATKTTRSTATRPSILESITASKQPESPLLDFPAVTVTRKAAATLRQHMAGSSGDTYLRVALVPGGCKGFMFTLDLTEHVSDADKTWTHSGINIVARRSQLEMLQGSVVDFQQAANGQQGFSMSIPNFDGPDASKWIAQLSGL